MAHRRSFLDADEVDDLAAEAGLIDRSSEPRSPVAPVRFAYTGASLAVAPVAGTSQWVTRAIAVDGRDPELSPRMLRLRATRPPGVEYVVADALLDWSLACAEASGGLLLTAELSVLAQSMIDPAFVEATRYIVAAARSIAEPRQGVSIALPVSGGVLRICWPGSHPNGVVAAFVCESDPGDAFSDELGAIVGTIALSPVQPIVQASAPVLVAEAGLSPDGEPVRDEPLREEPVRDEPVLATAAVVSSNDPGSQSFLGHSAVLVPVPDGDDFAEIADDESASEPEPASTDTTIDDLLDLIEAAAAPRWALLRVALRTRTELSRLKRGAVFTHEERERVRHAVGRVLVMELP